MSKVIVSVLCVFPSPNVTLPSPRDDIHGTAIVDKNAAHIIFSEVHRGFANVGPDDERVTVGVMLKPNISFVESYWDMRLGVQKCLPSHT